tara:strand:+ start:3217 stop:4296 length:1080 start_codon:yes stop_codon:yes gene_type:complete
MKKIFLILLFFIAFSCIDEKPAEYEEKLIVFSSITGGLSMGVGGDTCVVSLSNEITNDVDPQSLFISNALVIISENGSDTADTLFPVENKPGRYLTKPDVVFKNGKTYNLNVTWNNFSVTSETTIPDSIKISSPNNEYYICDGEQLKVDSIQTDNFDIDLLPVSSFEELIPFINLDNISTAYYKDDGCYIGSFASFPLFLIDFEAENSKTIQIFSQALERWNRGLEPDSDDNNSISFWDYNKNGIQDSSFTNLIYDTSFVYLIWKGDYLRYENGEPFRINPGMWQVSLTPTPMSWLYFDYYGMHLITIAATDDSYYNYYSGDPAANNQYLLPNSNINNGYGLFFSKASKSFLVNIASEE